MNRGCVYVPLRDHGNASANGHLHRVRGSVNMSVKTQALRPQGDA